MSERLPKFDSHVIDYFLNMADSMEKHLDDETYASVKRIFSKDVFMYEVQYEWWIFKQFNRRNGVNDVVLEKSKWEKNFWKK